VVLVPSELVRMESYSQYLGENPTWRSRSSCRVEIGQRASTSKSQAGEPWPQFRSDAMHTFIPGGLKGYSEGNNKRPWYSPPVNGESGGPR
jgi:hypothetical protein